MIILNNAQTKKLEDYSNGQIIFNATDVPVKAKKAKYFITCGELTSTFSQPIIGINELRPERLRPLLLSKAQQKRAAAEQQLMLDFEE